MFKNLDMMPPRASMSCKSHVGILAMVRELEAVCTFPVCFLKESKDIGGLLRIPIQNELPATKIFLATRSGLSLTPAGGLLADCIRYRAGVVKWEWDVQDTLAGYNSLVRDDYRDVQIRQDLFQFQKTVHRALKHESDVCRSTYGVCLSKKAVTAKAEVQWCQRNAHLVDLL
jgi:hypothetical protein